MALIALSTANRVEVVEMVESAGTFPAAEDISAGAPISLDSDGNWVNTDLSDPDIDTPLAIATRSVKSGAALTGMKRGILDGFDFTSQAYGAEIFVSNTAGRLEDAPGDARTSIGRVMPATAHPPITVSHDKVLHVDISYGSADPSYL